MKSQSDSEHFKSASLCVQKSRAAIVPAVSLTIETAGRKRRKPVTGLIIEHSAGDCSGCGVSQRVSLACPSGENSFYHCLLFRSHMVRVKVGSATAALLAAHCCGCCTCEREEAHIHLMLRFVV